ncbi:MAG: TIGR02206 family membrane protein [Verrucomicrobia bacterium]|nr:MAG: TIGR02206 family membrane protein [Verrucomicrobiota bacterium]
MTAMPPPFQPFSAQHWIALAIGTLVLLGLLVAGRRGGRPRVISTGLLAFANLTVYPLSVAAWRSLGGPLSPDKYMPLHLCDLAAIIAGFAILTRRPLLCSLTYFWGLAATSQALLTPALTVAFPSGPFVMFFVQHFAVVGAALYLVLVDGWRPKQPLWRGPAEAFGWGVGYLCMVLCVNRALDTNFGFATHPPDNPSLLDHLGAWPWYVVSSLAIALTLFFVLALPFRVGRPR